MDSSDVLRFALIKGHLTNTQLILGRTFLSSKFTSLSQLALINDLPTIVEGRAKPSDSPNLNSIYLAMGALKRTYSWTATVNKYKTWAMISSDALTDEYPAVRAEALKNLTPPTIVVPAICYEMTETPLTPIPTVLSASTSINRVGSIYLRSASQVSMSVRAFQGWQQTTNGENEVSENWGNFSTKCYNAVTSPGIWKSVSKTQTPIVSCSLSLTPIALAYKTIVGSSLYNNTLTIQPTNPRIIGDTFTYDLSLSSVVTTLLYDAQADYDAWLQYEPITISSSRSAHQVLPLPMLERLVPIMLSKRNSRVVVSKR